jgi:2-polyprenyl-6-methoxyphenol hydroxylase-like FAD-dependent oxidoreductase
MAVEAVETVEVAVVGGGPNGLLLAAELRLAGVPALVLERAAEPSTMPRANGLVGSVVQAMDARGLLERLAGGPIAPAPTPFYQFSGIPLDLRELADNPLYILPVPQLRIEQVLEERALELGAEIRRGHEVTALEQDAESATVSVHGPDGDYRVRARYVVGADGGRSLVRKLLGIGFPGFTDHAFSSHVGYATLPADMLVPGTGELDVPGLGRRLRPYAHNRMPEGVFTFALLPPGADAYLVAVFEWNRPVEDSSSISHEELNESVNRVLGAELPLGEPPTPRPHLPRRLAGINSRQAETYRSGRVLLLGDAAHVHSAVGGPGLNLGLQDTLNLGWKLAAAAQGWAPAGLLDSFEAERAPVSRRVLMQTRAQMALMAPGEELTSARELLGELFQDPANRSRISRLLAGTDHRYDFGADAHPLAGAWLPALLPQLPDVHEKAAQLMRDARAVLLDLTPESAAAAAAQGWSDRVEIVAAPRAEPAAPAAALLARPDGFVAWAADDSSDSAVAGLEEALRTWFGAANGA